jgi:hypothetical protein
MERYNFTDFEFFERKCLWHRALPVSGRQKGAADGPFGPAARKDYSV